MAVQEAPQLEGQFEEPLEEPVERVGEAPVPASPVKDASKHTRPYYVLRKTTNTSGEKGTFDLIGTYEASGDKQAVKKAIVEHGVGSYIAVAESAWHEHNVKEKKHPPTFEFS